MTASLSRGAASSQLGRGRRSPQTAAIICERLRCGGERPRRKAHPFLPGGIISCQCTNRSGTPSGTRFRPGARSVLPATGPQRAAINGDIKSNREGRGARSAAAVSLLYSPGKRLLQ